MKRKLFIILLAFSVSTLLYSCYTSYLRNLELSYSTDNDSIRTAFFEKWINSYKAISDSSYNKLDDTLKVVYDVGEAFYNIDNIRKIDNWDLYKGYNDSVKYFVIGTDLEYSVKLVNYNTIFLDTNLISKVKSLKDTVRYISVNFLYDGKNKYQKLNNYFPRNSMKNKEVLYLTSKYEIALSIFIGIERSDIGTFSIMTPSLPYGNSRNKIKYLSHEIDIMPTHWGDGWIIASPPEILSITLFKVLEHAFVESKVIYTWLLSYFEKVGGKWVLRWHHYTAIE